MRRRWVLLFGVLVLAAGLTTGGILVAARSGSRANPVAQRGAENAVGVRFTPATPPANALSRADAITAARGRDLRGVKVKAAFGIATDTQYYLERKNGTRHYYVKNRPVWIVSLIGPGTVPDLSGPRFPGSRRTGAEPNREMNVVIDGFTGKELEEYSYR